uniref:Uncharacterized protein n=1 Tax=Arundo donax TaxID=35708 RepID=A0A0A9GS20_ARUDO
MCCGLKNGVACSPRNGINHHEMLKTTTHQHKLSYPYCSSCRPCFHGAKCTAQHRCNCVGNLRKLLQYWHFYSMVSTPW